MFITTGRTTGETRNTDVSFLILGSCGSAQMALRSQRYGAVCLQAISDTGRLIEMMVYLRVG
jgi:hypothetical protein